MLALQRPGLHIWPHPESTASALQPGPAAASGTPLALRILASLAKKGHFQGYLLPKEKTCIVEGKRAFSKGMGWAAPQTELTPS